MRIVISSLLVIVFFVISGMFFFASKNQPASRKETSRSSASAEKIGDFLKPEGMCFLAGGECRPKKPVAEPARVHWSEDRYFAKKYDKSGDRSLRAKTDSTKPVFKKRWLDFRGGEYIPLASLESLADVVLKRMPHVLDRKLVKTLVVETAVAESVAGFYISSKRGDHGIFQIRVEVAEETLGWLKHTHADIYEAVMLFYDKSRSMAANLDSNIPFSMALASVEYWRKAGPDFHNHIASVEDRAIMWKSVYNSSKGEGTVNAFSDRVKKYAAFDKAGGPAKYLAKKNEKPKRVAMAKQTAVKASATKSAATKSSVAKKKDQAKVASGKTAKKTVAAKTVKTGGGKARKKV